MEKARKMVFAVVQQEKQASPREALESYAKYYGMMKAAWARRGDSEEFNALFLRTPERLEKEMGKDAGALHFQKILANRRMEGAEDESVKEAWRLACAFYDAVLAEKRQGEANQKV